MQFPCSGSTAVIPMQTRFGMRALAQRFALKSIGARIAASVILLMVLVVSVISWFGYSQQRDLGALSVDIRLKQAYERVGEELKARERISSTLALAIANTPGIGERIENNDRAWLIENMNGVFRTARDAQGTNLVNVHKAPGIAFVRWHAPNLFGDDLRGRRQSVVKAIASGQPQAGLEPGRDSLGMFAVVPIRFGDKIVGVSDVGTAVGQPLADDLKKRLGIDIAFHIFGDGKFETPAGTIPNKSLLAAEDLKTAMTARTEPRYETLGDKHVVSTAGPLLNFAGTPIGTIEIVLDISDIVSRSRQSLLIFAGAATISILLGLIVSIALARGIGRPIREITDTMRSLADGNIELTVPHGSRTDEIGVMAATIETFRKGIIDQRNLEAEATLQRVQAEQLRERNEREREQAEQQRLQLEKDAADQRALAENERHSNADAQRKGAEEQATAMKALANGLARVADGDLTITLNEGFTDSYRQIKDDFNATVSRLHETMQALAEATRDVSNAAIEISTSSTDLSQRTEEQAAGLEKTAASMGEIASTVKKNAENANQANQFITDTRKIADRSAPIVASAIEAMSRIEDSSGKISDIIGVIDEIARQTNLLALNAAVEAARAGDAGRGFAVVATEVRSLSQRSSQAAKDIKDLIIMSNGQVKDGVELVDRAGASLNEIAGSVKKVADIVANIATASAAQAVGVDQVNKALSEIDEVTQQNSAVVEENTATAKTLEMQSAAMQERVNFFRLAVTGNASASGRPLRQVA
jgi:methyl-accepting chemotaxis protein